MILNLENLKEMDGFVGRPVQKEITWSGHTATVYVRRLSYQAIVANIDDWQSDSDAVAKYIAATTCDEAGTPIFTPGDITGETDPERGPLDGALTVALLNAISEVNPQKNPTS